MPTWSYLTLVKDGPVAVEELKWRKDMTLNQRTGHDSRSSPPPRTDWHLEEPLLQRYLTQLAFAASEQSRHCVSWIRVGGLFFVGSGKCNKSYSMQIARRMASLCFQKARKNVGGEALVGTSYWQRSLSCGSNSNE